MRVYTRLLTLLLTLGLVPGLGAQRRIGAEGKLPPPSQAAPTDRLVGVWMVAGASGERRAIAFKVDSTYLVFEPESLVRTETFDGTRIDTVRAIAIADGLWRQRPSATGELLLCVQAGRMNDPDAALFRGEQCGTLTSHGSRTAERYSWKSGETLIGFQRRRPVAMVRLPSIVEHREASRIVSTDQPYFEFQVEKTVSTVPGQSGPRYPEMLKSANIEGEVLAQFIVDADGRY